MLSVTALTRISHLMKMAVVLILFTSQLVFNLHHLRLSFEWYDLKYYQDDFKLGHQVVLSIVVGTAAVVLFIINRQVSLQQSALDWIGNAHKCVIILHLV